MKQISPLVVILGYQVKKVTETLRQYGMGTRGLRWFFDTNAHSAAEESLAEFSGSKEACLYSSAFAAVSNAIPLNPKPNGASLSTISFGDVHAYFAIQ